jgi:hypothetical protein
MSTLEQPPVSPTPVVGIYTTDVVAPGSDLVLAEPEPPRPKEDEEDAAPVETAKKRKLEESNSILQRERRKVNAPCRLHDASEWEKVMDAPQLKKAAIKPSQPDPTIMAVVKETSQTPSSDKQNKENEENEKNDEEEWRNKAGIDKNGRPQRRTKGVAPARLADAEQWKKVMECPQLKQDVKYHKKVKSAETPGEEEISFVLSGDAPAAENQLKPSTKSKRGKPAKPKATNNANGSAKQHAISKQTSQQRQYLVEEVLGHRVVNTASDTSDNGENKKPQQNHPKNKRRQQRERGVEYLVKWSNMPESHNSWEPEANLSGCKHKVDGYWNKHSTWKLMQCSSHEGPDSVSKVMYTDQKFRIIKDQHGKVFFYFLP